MTIRRTRMLIALASALAMVGCASTPRAFSPTLVDTPADQSAYEAAFQACSQSVADGQRGQFGDGRAGSGLGGAAIGGGVGAAAGGAAAAGLPISGLAAATGLMTGLVVFAPLAMYGVSRVQRAHKEHEIREAMSACLAESGYTVAEWQRARMDQTGLSSPTRAGPR